MVEAFRSRPLASGPYTHLWLDALTQKVREGGRVVDIPCASASGHRRCWAWTSGDGAGWTAFLWGLAARGLSGVSPVISHAHPGLVDAVASTLPGASWQRCRTHFARNPLYGVPKAW